MGSIVLNFLELQQHREGGPASSAAARLRLLLQRDDIVVCPGVYDGFTARIALAAGFECLYMVTNSIISNYEWC